LGGFHFSFVHSWLTFSFSSHLISQDLPNGTIYLEEYRQVQVTQDRPKIKNCFALIPNEGQSISDSLVSTMKAQAAT